MRAAALLAVLGWTAWAQPAQQEFEARALRLLDSAAPADKARGAEMAGVKRPQSATTAGSRRQADSG